jgi:biopolymer transport protein ExbD
VSRKRNPFLEVSAGSQDMSLNITAMADIFTIILVFMLKSFGGGGVGSPPLSGLTLPTSDKGEAPTAEMIKLEISRGGVLVEGRQVARLENYRFAAEDLDEDGTSRPLKIAFALERARSTPGRKVATDDPTRARMMVYMDRDVPYATVRKALASAAQAGFAKFRLVVQRPEG